MIEDINRELYGISETQRRWTRGEGQVVNRASGLPIFGFDQQGYVDSANPTTPALPLGADNNAYASAASQRRLFYRFESKATGGRSYQSILSGLHSGDVFGETTDDAISGLLLIDFITDEFDLNNVTWDNQEDLTYELGEEEDGTYLFQSWPAPGAFSAEWYPVRLRISSGYYGCRIRWNDDDLYVNNDSITCMAFPSLEHVQVSDA